MAEENHKRGASSPTVTGPKNNGILSGEQKSDPRSGGKEQRMGDKQPDQPAENNDGHGSQKPPVRKPFFKRPWVMVVTLLVLVVGGYFGVRYLIHAFHYQSTDDAFIDGHVVQISTQVSGYVAQLLVTDNQLVQEGEVMLVINQRDYVAARDQARAADEAARNRVEQALAQVEANTANLAAAKATAKDAASNLAIAKQTFASKALSRQDYDAAIASAKNATEQVNAAVANLSASKLKVGEAQAAAAQAEAQLRQAELNLGYTTIIAPTTGRVTRRTVEQGNYLQPGQALFALVEPNLWVTANYKETALTHMQAGQQGTITIDAYPDRPLAVHIDSFQRGSGARFSLLPAENATGNFVKIVQRVPVKLLFNEALPSDMILGPGMSVVPDIKVR